jgi:hypothetical protein
MRRLTDNTLIVIREAGERTREICIELARAQVGADAVEIVAERPFEEALRQCYLAGIRRGRKWTMTLDADVLLRAGAIARLYAEAEAMPEHFAQVEGLVFDKISGSFREAGQRIYRTALLPLALEQTPAPGAAIRPEYSTLLGMDALGHPSRRVAVVMGVHDHKQFFRDLYRKAFVHANKHDKRLTAFVRRCRSLMSTDADFRVILRGLWDGLLHAGPVWIDTRAYPEDLSAILGELRLTEKSRLAADAIDSDTVERWLADAGPAPEFVEWSKPGKATPAVPEALGSRIRRLLRQRGLVRTAFHLAGVGLCRTGARLKQRGAVPGRGSMKG